MGTMIFAAGTASKSGSNPGFTFLILAVLIGLFYVLIMRPQRARQRKAVQTQSQVMPGQRVRTTAGMYGTVVSGDDRDVVVEIAPGVEVTMLRRAIMDVISDDQPDVMPETIDEPDQPQDSSDWDFKDGSSADDTEHSQDNQDTKDRNA